MLVWEQISCSQGVLCSGFLREIVLRAKDLESETVESRSRNGAPFALTCERNRTGSGLDSYEFMSWVVCALRVSPLSIYFDERFRATDQHYPSLLSVRL